MSDEVRDQIQIEIKQIDKHIKSYEELLQKSQECEPDLIELTALASVLHAIYNGIEKIFIIIAKKIDKDIPDGKQWHKEILMQTTRSGINREEVISEGL